MSYIEGDIPDGLIVVLLLVDGGREVLPGRVVVHAPAHRPAGVPALLHPRRDRRDPCSTSSCWRPCTASSQLSGTVDAGARSPSRAGRPHPDVWLLVGLFAAGYAIAIVRLGPRWRPPDSAVVTRFQVTLLVARRARDLARVRLADPRHRRAVQLQRPHGAAPAVHDGAAPLLLLGTRPGCCAGCSRRAGCFDTVRTLARFIPALVLFNLVLVFTHWPRIVNESAAQRSRALPAARAAVRLVAHRVDADREPAARDPAARSRCCRCSTCSPGRWCPRCRRRSSPSDRRRCTSTTSTCRTCSG